MLPFDVAALALDPEHAIRAEAAALEVLFGDRDAREILEVALKRLFPGEIALVSSFGADSAALLHMVSEIDEATPVIFLDTGKHFGETKSYRDALVDRLGLTNVRSPRPDEGQVKESDPIGTLWMRDPDTCCHMRKTVSLERALEGFEAWITGRKRFQSDERARLPVFEANGNRVKVNPLASWSAKDILAYRERHHLPPHPLVEQGFLSIGCMPCTTRVGPGEDARAGRWRGSEKTECGIHLETHGHEIDGSGI